MKRSKKLSAIWYKQFIAKQKGKAQMPKYNGEDFQQLSLNIFHLHNLDK